MWCLVRHMAFGKDEWIVYNHLFNIQLHEHICKLTEGTTCCLQAHLISQHQLSQSQMKGQFTIIFLTKYSITWTHIMQTDWGNHVLLASSHLTSQHQLSQSHFPVVWYLHTVSRLKGCCKPDTLLLCLQYKQTLLPSAAKTPPDCVISMKNTPPPTKWMEDLGFLLDLCYLLDKTCLKG